MEGEIGKVEEVRTREAKQAKAAATAGVVQAAIGQSPLRICSVTICWPAASAWPEMALAVAPRSTLCGRITIKATVSQKAERTRNIGGIQVRAGLMLLHRPYTPGIKRRWGKSIEF